MEPSTSRIPRMTGYRNSLPSANPGPVKLSLVLPPSDVLPHTPGYVDRGAGNIGGAIAGQKGDDTGDLIRLAEPAERHLFRGQAPEEFFRAQFGSPPLVDIVPL